MKNEAIASEGSPEEAWSQALRRFDRELQRRGAAERTRRAYATDVGELATWAAAQGLRPADVRYPLLRRWAARNSGAGAAPRTMARKLPPARPFSRVLVEPRAPASTPAALPAPPNPPQPPPPPLRPPDGPTLLTRTPAATPLELRDKA